MTLVVDSKKLKRTKVKGKLIHGALAGCVRAMRRERRDRVVDDRL